MNHITELSSDQISQLIASISEATDDREREMLEDRVVRSCLPLAERLAARYRNRGADHDDLTAVANLALVHAVRRFEPASPVSASVIRSRGLLHLSSEESPQER